MAKQGDTYLVIDGKCTFFAFRLDLPSRGLDAGDHGSPRRNSPRAIGGRSRHRDLATLSSGSLTDPQECGFESPRYDFFLADEANTCFCCSQLAVGLFFRAADVIFGLYATGTQYEAPTLEAFVFRPYTYYEPVPEPAGWAVEWGAAQSPESIQEWPIMDPYRDMGFVVTEADRPWFAALIVG